MQLARFGSPEPGLPWQHLRMNVRQPGAPMQCLLALGSKRKKRLKLESSKANMQERSQESLLLFQSRQERSQEFLLPI